MEYVIEAPVEESYTVREKGKGAGLDWPTKTKSPKPLAENPTVPDPNVESIFDSAPRANLYTVRPLSEEEMVTSALVLPSNSTFCPSETRSIL
ncbi:MAG: hypothetical protein SOW20_01685 [Berryella intestinalis]|uniref:hypothetical protein n=1 Tax=Berryella intestinalis TaxID=1531429 RepID=UPI002A74BC0B|nr:hypothetical protein [Berryella intestinalis]MDY3128726.1 hypothetical protein [Berryella intestinalis]